MLTVKAVLRLSNLVFFAILPLLGFAEESHRFIEGQPVYWVDKSFLVSNEYVNINIDIDIISPCHLKAFPLRFEKTAQEVDRMRFICTKKHQYYFLLPLKEICHRDQKEQEPVPIDTGNKNVSIKVKLLVGYGSIYSSSSIHGDNDISKMKLEQPNTTDVVNYTDVSKTVESRLSGKYFFDDLLELQGLDVGEYTTRGAFVPYYHYLLQLISLSWDKTHIPEDFLKVIGVEDFHQAFGDVLLEQVENFNCSFNSDSTNFKLTFSLPKINWDLRIFHAEAFNLTESYKDYTCVLKYNGTENVIWSTEQNCIVAKDVNASDPVRIPWFGMKTKLLLNASNSCMPMTYDDNPYFAVSACYKRAMWEPGHFVTSKFINGTLHLYCNGGVVNYPTENDPPISCPPFVFLSNSTLINHRNIDRYDLLMLREHYNITVLPASLSEVVSRKLLSARLNTTAIMMSERPKGETKIMETKKFLFPPVVIALYIIMGFIILVMILVALVYAFRKFGFTFHTEINNLKVKFYRNQIQSDRF